MDTIIPADRWVGPTTQLFAFIGVLYVSLHIMSFWRMMASCLVLPGMSLSKCGPKGSWAIVTGASENLGKEFAMQLAAKGFNVLLISRTASKLDALAKEIETKYSNVKAKTLAMDFAKNQDSDYDAIRSTVANMDVAILVNNVGAGHDIPVPFVETPADEMHNIVMVNCMGTLRITKLIIPGMTQRRRGLILTMASFGGLVPTPLLATYSGSKAFLQQWTSALGAELASTGITVELVLPYYIAAGMSKIRRPSLFIPDTRTYIKSVLNKVGRSGGAQAFAFTSNPYWSHAIFQWLLTTVPGPTSWITVTRSGIINESIRKRAVAKRAREAKKQ